MRNASAIAFQLAMSPLLDLASGWCLAHCANLHHQRLNSPPASESKFHYLV